MIAPIAEYHFFDDQGMPAGGRTSGVGLDIVWQNGPLSVDGVRSQPNGAFVETVIAAAVGRIEYYQSTRFHSLHNAIALGHLRAALEVLEERTATDRLEA